MKKNCFQGYTGEPGDAGPPGDDANLIPVRNITFFSIEFFKYLILFNNISYPFSRFDQSGQREQKVHVDKLEKVLTVLHQLGKISHRFIKVFL